MSDLNDPVLTELAQASLALTCCSLLQHSHCDYKKLSEKVFKMLACSAVSLPVLWLDQP